jgi:hypothetical protein
MIVGWLVVARHRFGIRERSFGVRGLAPLPILLVSTLDWILAGNFARIGICVVL